MNHTTVNDKHTSRYRILFYCGLLLLTLIGHQLRAQNTLDSIVTADTSTAPGLTVISQTKDNSAIIIHPETKRKGVFAWKDSILIPKRSAMYSMLFPGLGQINNGQYWKLPIVYGLLGAGIYFFQDNLKNYNQYRLIYANRLNNIYTDKYVGVLNDADIKGWRDYHKKYLDMTVLLSAVGYGLQIMDANVFAHLKHFDISEDIGFMIKPSFQPTPWGISTGVGLAFQIK